MLIAGVSILALVAVFPGSPQTGPNRPAAQPDTPSPGKEPTSGPSTAIDGGRSAGQSERRSGSADPQALLGVWNRPGESYFLEIRRWYSDGALEAAYFNPRPINVAKAHWRRNGDSLTILVELRDVGYPGSTYNLAYHPDQDMLAGEYFQAGTGATYRVEFVRVQQPR